MVKELDITKDYIVNIEYLKDLINDLKLRSASSFDDKMIYDVVYADLYVSTLMLKVSAPVTVKSINNIKTSLDTILDNLPLDVVSNIRNSIDCKQFDVVRFNSGYKNDYFEDSAYKYVEDLELLKCYIPSQLLLSIVPIIFIWFLNKFLLSFTPLLGVWYIYVTNIFTSFIAILIGLYGVVSIVVDSAYILVPSVNESFQESLVENFIIKKMNKSCIDKISESKYVRYYKIRQQERVDRNMSWLKSLLDLSSITSDVIYDELINISNTLQKSYKYSSEYYVNLAKIEMMRDKYYEGKED